eukprot:TRINITY_DN1040_c0_g3_i1.p1 TRINITY_DN1040_c0_g3~~TRINITY_DN1040_c0_g3_i1.p1  ORF type:complete len:1192 (-),score=391.23 TRINITY_DN1040_c0_g3_i1:125-3700(-)
MYLYNLTLQRAGAITQCVYGNFSASKAHEVLISRGKVIELLRPDSSGKVHSVCSQEVFGVIRSLQPFRLTGASKDCIVIASDSGRIVIVEYDEARNQFIKIHQETFGKSGCRRIVPGQYLATDPKGRAVMIGATEKQKLVYILNRDSAARLTISSPLEAHRANHIIFNIVGIDVGFDNPTFAVIEMDYSEADEPLSEEQMEEGLSFPKQLTYYELDLGLNHVVRKWSERCDDGANMLIPVPGGVDGPSGCLVCGENWVVYRAPEHAEIRCVIPRRASVPEERSVLLVNFTTIRQKGMFLFLAQSEFGDLYRISLDTDNETVTNVHISYFDSAPVCSSICFIKTGFMFAASELGNHSLFQFLGLGEDTDDIAVNALTEFEESWPSFEPRPLKNLLLTDEMESLCPVLDFKVTDLAHEGTPQMYALCGNAHRSSLKVLRHGLSVTEMAVSTLPGNPNAVWTVKRSAGEVHDKYIVVSFRNATLVLSIGETVEEVTDSGLLLTAATLNVGLVGEHLVQVHPTGLRHIRQDKRIAEWQTPGKKAIVKAALNHRQVVLALSGGELVYFELDLGGQLVEVEKKDMGQDVACVDLGPVPEGRQRSRWLAVGGYDNTVKLVSLDPDDCLQVMSQQALPTRPESLCLIEMVGHSTNSQSTTLYLTAGLENGVMVRTLVDGQSGSLSDTRTRFLGTLPVKLSKVTVNGTPGMLALSTRSWLAYTHQGRQQLHPMSYESLEHASNFTSEVCPEGIVAVTGDTLRILGTERLGELFNQTSHPLSYTPRKFCKISAAPSVLAIIESDHNAVREQPAEEPAAEAMEDGAEEEDEAAKAKMLIGPNKGRHGQWASCIRLMEGVNGDTLDKLEFDDNEAAFSLCTCTFTNTGQEYLIVGTAKDMTLYPRTITAGFLYTYLVVNGGRNLQLVHKTATEEVPYALCAFQGRLLVGLAKTLRIYDLGKKKLLRKCENRAFPNFIVSLQAIGDRIVVGDIQESFLFVKYRKIENQLLCFADDTYPRWLTAQCNLDYDTMVGADKFGNIFVARLPDKVNDDLVDDPTGMKVRPDSGYLNGAPHKLNEILQFHVGEVVCSLTKTALVPGGVEAIVYTTIMGSIGCFIPFTSREDIDFFQHLEMHMRQAQPPLAGRDHLAYRSYYYPCKDVVDGDLCEQFNLLKHEVQSTIGEELDRTPNEVLKKLEDLRNRVL